MDTNRRTSDFVTVGDIRLHYLDWGRDGPALLFIPGFGCTAYIFDAFAPRFTDQFHVLALTRRGHGDSDDPETGYDVDTLTEDLRQFLDALHIDQVILVGHSMAYLELSRFAELYPQRLLKLIYLDAAYDRTNPEYQAVQAKNPLPKLIPPYPENCHTIEDYIAADRRLYPAINAIWGPLMDEEMRHRFRITPEGRAEEKLSGAIAQALETTMATYQANYAAAQAPLLSFFSIIDGYDYLSPDYMTAEQQAEVLNFIQTELAPYQKRNAGRFRQSVPQASVVEILSGHHYCFIKQAELVYTAMRTFLNV